MTALALPSPHGPHQVGTQDLWLLDEDRTDPWRQGHHRELMARLWYPVEPDAVDGGVPVGAVGCGGEAEPGGVEPGAVEPDPAALPAGYLPPEVAAHVLGMWAEEGEEFGPDLHAALAGVRVHAVRRPPAGDRPAPLVLLSPGLGEYAAGLTALAEDLASRGFLVAAVDHPYDAAAVRFPDGTLAPHHEPGDDLETRYLPTRVADLRLVLDRLLAPGSPLRVDPARIGAAGHSLGGAAVAELARTDPRLCAVAVLDGSLYGEVLSTGLDLPVLLCGLTPPDPDDPDVLAGWDALWPRLRGPRRRTTVEGAGHMSATDFDALAGPLGLRGPGDPDDVFNFGTLPEGHGLARVRRELAEFLAEHTARDLRPAL
ncbi:hypothetical protein [Nonomuraea longicatena]|uniref:Lipase n=1 Tax=Nonomuraea longicatena TaxID=83682 RepID=A0ABN1PCH5_9ACTN